MRGSWQARASARRQLERWEFGRARLKAPDTKTSKRHKLFLHWGYEYTIVEGARMTCSAPNVRIHRRTPLVLVRRRHLCGARHCNCGVQRAVQSYSRSCSFPVAHARAPGTPPWDALDSNFSRSSAHQGARNVARSGDLGGAQVRSASDAPCAGASSRPQRRARPDLAHQSYSWSATQGEVSRIVSMPQLNSDLLKLVTPKGH